ncbi:GNAT family N-acetyltransferase [Arthrobacter sp. STN4]|uniref:GNAT family N-acetyltransferase n=1 Tax=Arthrobacter sp. STN4 TaxID=2923276 RepID=UPI002119E4C0|nr:GNAT family N-acetyltransferase [Arthrobacter sp. STN4]MCQ9164363.1 GNAT family N-acetyltransferase [Arthrobacter sp. STN4]
MTHAAPPPAALDELEALMDRAWPAPVREVLDGWVLRSAGSVTQRANSVWPAAAPPDLEAAFREATAWYATRRQPVIFQLTDRPENAAVARLLDRHGYSRQSETLIMTAAGPGAAPVSGPAAGIGTAPGVAVSLADTPSEDWLDLWWRVDGRGGAAERHLARSIIQGTPSLYASAVDGQGTVMGTGRLSLLDGWGGVYCMATHPGFRRQGIASAVLDALLGAGREAGAARFWLMATEANAAARALYESAGFAEAGRYHYRQAPLRRAPPAC